MDRSGFQRQVEAMVEFVDGKVHSELICERCGCAQMNVHNIDQAVPESLGILFGDIILAAAVVRSDRV